jgi:uncharacterized protein YeaO (DUF488 family)
MTGQPEIRVRRVYDEPSPEDGTRVLVDRIWPRGLAKERAGIDEWAKAVAPSTELRRWYGHDPARFEEFRRRYQAELAEPERRAALRHLRELARSGRLTLVTATRDIDHSQAAVLAQHLRGTR